MDAFDRIFNRAWERAEEKKKQQMNRIEQLRAAAPNGDLERLLSVAETLAEKPEIAAAPDASHLEFDGCALKWYDGDQLTDNWPAVSGKRGQNNPAKQDIKNVGPIPEGDWHVNQDRYQEIKDARVIDWVGGLGRKGRWAGSIPAWGTKRVWVEPASGTDTHGRDNFSIHGGWFPGSGGCIDLTGQMPNFAKRFREYGQDMKLKVQYPADARFVGDCRDGKPVIPEAKNLRGNKGGGW